MNGCLYVHSIGPMGFETFIGGKCLASQGVHHIFYVCIIIHHRQGHVQANNGLSWSVSGNLNMKNQHFFLTWRDYSRYFYKESEYGVNHTWLCITLISHVFLYLTMFDHGWLCLTMVDYVWRWLILFDHNLLFFYHGWLHSDKVKHG